MISSRLKNSILVGKNIRYIHKKSNEGFTKGVTNYEKARPTYPLETLRLAEKVFELDKSDSGKINVLDLAAGTGKFTKILLNNQNLDISAVEPIEAMRKKFSEVLPKVPILKGTSTSIPFNDNKFQVVFIAQAFHWFANKESLKEIHRVLNKNVSSTKKVGLCLIWNIEDEKREPFVAELRKTYEHYEKSIPFYRNQEWKSTFNECNFFDKNLITKTISNSNYLPVDNIWPLLMSKSYVNTLPLKELEILKNKVEFLVKKYEKNFIRIPEIENKLCVHFPYFTEITWTFVK